jgi:carboxypeptidase D
MFGKDVATGKVTLAEVKGGYSTKGPDQVRDVKNEVPEPVKNTCYLMQAPTSCTKEQLAALANGSALIEDYVVVKPDGVAPAPL